MGRKAFLDPTTSRLKCHGFIESNDPGDIVMDVPENFSLDPTIGYKWDGTSFVSFPHTKVEDPKKKALRDAADKGSKDGDVKALAQALKDYLS